MATVREAAVSLMTQMCNDSRFGYYLGGRLTGYYDTFDVMGVDVQVPLGDYDCGGSIRKVYRLLGVNLANASSTNNMKYEMCDVAGTFIAHPWSDSYEMRPGDIALYVNPGYDGTSAFGHAAMCVGTDFSLAEFQPTNGLYDSNVGDQGSEGRIVPYYNYVSSSSWENGWTYCLELRDSIGNQIWGSDNSDEEDGTNGSDSPTTNLGAVPVVARRAAEVMYHLVTCPGHGYTQDSPGREGSGATETIALSDGAVVTIPSGDRDCSSAVISAYKAVLPGCTGDATYTGDMVEEFTKTGMWVWYPNGSGYPAKTGDIYLNEAKHAAMCLSSEPNLLMEFLHNENIWAGVGDSERYFGGAVGDQYNGDPANAESVVRDYYVYGYGGWDGVLAFVGGDAVLADPLVTAMQQELNVKLSAFGLYRVGVTGNYDYQTQSGLVRLLQASHNYDFTSGLAENGLLDEATLASMDAHPVAQDTAYEEAGNDAWVVKAMLVGLGAELDLSHWNFDSYATAALNAHKAAAGRAADGICRGADLLTLVPLLAPEPEPVVMPAIAAGTPAQDAEAQLEALGLAVEVVEQHSGAVAAGLVVSAEPAAGTELEPGASVTLYVSLGAEAEPGPEPTPDPNVHPTAVIPADLAAQLSDADVVVQYLLDLGFTDVRVVDQATGSPVSGYEGYSTSAVEPVGEQLLSATIRVLVLVPSPEPDPEPDDSWEDLVSTPADIANMQDVLNWRLSAFGLAGVSVTSAYDAQTQRGLVRLLQASHNVDFTAGLSITGYINAATAASMSAHPVGQGGETYGNDCWVVKAMLVGNGWVLDLSNWDVGPRELTAIARHKPYHGLPATPVCDGATLRSLAPAASV